MSTNIPYSIASNAKEFLAGMVAEQASFYKDQASAAKDINTFVKDIDTSLRTVYDKYIPNVHVINVDSFTNILANRIAEAGKNVLDVGSDTSVAKMFSDSSSKEYNGLRKVISDATKKYHSSLIMVQNGITNPIAELNNLSLKLFNRTRKLDNPIAARVLGIEFSRNINSVFGNRAILAAIDNSLGSSDSTYVFFTSSFNTLGSKLKDNIYKPAEEYIRETLGTDTVSEFGLGKLINAGHASLISDLDSFVNSPAFAQTVYGVASGRSARMSSNQVEDAAAVFKTESLLLENKIEVQKEFFSANKGYGVLLSLGVTFTNVEDAQLNQERGRSAERKTVASFKIAKPASMTPATLRRLQDTLMRIVFKNRPQDGRSSRSMSDFLGDALLGVLSGKPTNSETAKININSSTRVNRIVQNTSASATKFNNPTAPKSQKVALRNLLGHFYSVANLQSLINELLPRQIKNNMGDGTAKTVLNYRTGRFAESAKVERLSVSREGMISAFYTYMKNPYSTFSVGGLQSMPPSRDPKLLIGKSIREIAATKVANRMRAILV